MGTKRERVGVTLASLNVRAAAFLLERTRQRARCERRAMREAAGIRHTGENQASGRGA